MAGLIDTHCHLDDEQFASDLPLVVEPLLVVPASRRLIAVTTSAPSSHTCLELSRRYPGIVFASAGIHPNHITQATPTAWDEVVNLATNEPVVGIGETGLDRHWNDTPFPQQEDYFARHLALSRRTRKPIIIHCREAEVDVLRMLREEFDKNGPICGVMHSFVGGAEMATACREMGLYLSFAGMLTYKNSGALREVAAQQPLDRVLVETDSPYLAPVPLRGKRNEPANVVHTAACLAGLLGLSETALAEQSDAEMHEHCSLCRPRIRSRASASCMILGRKDMVDTNPHSEGCTIITEFVGQGQATTEEMRVAIPTGRMQLSASEGCETILTFSDRGKART